MVDIIDSFDFVEIQLDDVSDWAPPPPVDIQPIDWATLPEEPSIVLPAGDTFHFGADDGTVPQIADFAPGDKIELDGAAFDFAPGSAVLFQVGGNEEAGAVAKIVYEDWGGLVYVPAATGDDQSPDLARTFAALPDHPSLTAADFIVV
jgi:hypothetical protein